MSVSKEQINLDQIQVIQNHLLGQGVEQNLKKSIELFFDAVRKNPTIARQELFFPHKQKDMESYIEKHEQYRCFAVMKDKFPQETYKIIVEKIGAYKKGHVHGEKQSALFDAIKEYYETLIDYSSAYSFQVYFQSIGIKGFNEHHEYHFNLFSELAENKHYTPALLFMARYCHHNPKNIRCVERTIAAFYHLVVHGNPIIQYEFGKHLYISTTQYTFALILLHCSATQGCVPAQSFLGNRFVFSKFFNIDPFIQTRGLQLLQAAASQNDIDAQNDLTKITSQNGIDAPKEMKKFTERNFCIANDITREQEFYKLAKEKGFALAQYEFGISYAAKIKTETTISLQNAEYALQWYQRALCNRDIRSENQAILLYINCDSQMILHTKIYRAISDLAINLVFDTPVELLLTHSEIIPFVERLLNYDIGANIKRDIRYKLREIHYKLAQFYKHQNNISKQFEHIQAANLDINVDSILAAHIPRLRAEVEGCLVNLSPSLCKLVVEYALPQDEFSLEAAIKTLQRQKDLEIDLEKIKERTHSERTFTGGRDPGDTLFERSPVFRRF